MAEDPPVVSRELHRQRGPDGRRRWLRVRLGALGLGALPALAFPEPSLWWLGLTGLVPTLMLVQAAATPREATMRGWFAGAGFALAAHHWLVPNVGPFALPLAFFLGVPVAAWGRLAWHLLRRVASAWDVVMSSIVLASGWVVFEVARSWEPLGGPWALLGASAWRTRWLLSPAALGGVWLVTFVMVVVNVAATEAVAPGSTRRVRAAAAMVAASVLAATVLWSELRPEPGFARMIRVVGIQPGVIHEVAPRFAASEAATRRAGRLQPDLVVWGESSVGLDPESRPAYLRRIQEASAAAGAEVLANVDARRGPGGIFKSSLLVGPDGIRGRYDKRRFVPFGEYIPLRAVFAWVEWLPRAPEEDRQRGDGLVLLRSKAALVGPLICFESAFPDMSRRLAARGAQIIVVQSSTSTFQESWAPEQHASLAAIRAVETGRPVVHATLTGVSAAFDGSGRRLTWFSSSRTGTYVADVPLSRRTAPYVRVGEWVPALSVMVLAVASGVALARRVITRAREPTAPSRRPVSQAPERTGAP